MRMLEYSLNPKVFDSALQRFYSLRYYSQVHEVCSPFKI